MSAAGQEQRQWLTVLADPRIPVTLPERQAALAYSQAAGTALDQAFVANGEVHALREKLGLLQPKLSGATLVDAQALLKDTADLTESDDDAGSDIAAISEVIAGLEADVEGADGAPTPGQQAALTEYRGRLDKALARWQQLRSGALNNLNAKLTAAGMPAIELPKPEQFVPQADEGGKDLP